MKSTLIAQYIRLLRELSEIRASRFPEILLPASKEHLRLEIQELDKQGFTTQLEKSLDPPELLFASRKKIRLEAQRLDEQNVKAELENSLDMFSPDPYVATTLASTLITPPFAISLIYSLWIAFHGAHWTWVIASIPILLLPASLCLAALFIGKKLTFIKQLVLELGKFVGFGCHTAIAVRLFGYSGLVGLYDSTFQQFNFFELILSLLALFTGFHFIKQGNRLYYFLNTNKYKGLSPGQ